MTAGRRVLRRPRFSIPFDARARRG